MWEDHRPRSQPGSVSADYMLESRSGQARSFHQGGVHPDWNLFRTGRGLRPGRSVSARCLASGSAAGAAFRFGSRAGNRPRRGAARFAQDERLRRGDVEIRNDQELER